MRIDVLLLGWREDAPASTRIEVVLGAGGPMGPAAGEAGQVSFDDALTALGVDNVQDAIVALFELIGSGVGPPGGQFDFSKPANSALIQVM